MWENTEEINTETMVQTGSKNINHSESYAGLKIISFIYEGAISQICSNLMISREPQQMGRRSTTHMKDLIEAGFSEYVRNSEIVIIT